MMNLIFKLSTLLFVVTGLSANAQQTKNVSVKNFNAISVSSGIDLYLTQGNTETVNIKSDNETLENVVVEQNDGTLTIKFKDGVKWSRMLKNRMIKVYVDYKTLTAISASGGADVYTQNQMKADKMAIRSSGGSDLKLNLICNNLVIESSGGSDIDLKGKAENMTLQASGGSDIDAYDFITEYAKVSASGGSDINIYVNKGLEASASGGADVSFKGNAALKKTSSSKSGEVSRAN